MKNYKLVCFKGFTEKARKLGYKWDVISEEHAESFYKFVFLNSDGTVSHLKDDHIYYSECNCQEITQADFLALPEPLKVKKWVIEPLGLQRFLITNISVLEDVPLRPRTKLTKQQIDILELES